MSLTYPAPGYPSLRNKVKCAGRRSGAFAPPSRPSAATLIGRLRPGSLRVHAPCKTGPHGSRLGFPGRRTPRGPAALGNVARGLQAPPGKYGCGAGSRGRGGPAAERAGPPQA